MMDLEADILSCLQVLRAGGLILYPTDTVWGIGCDATNEKAVAQAYALKNRLDRKPLIVLVTEEQDILKHVAAPDLSVFDYVKTCSKPTSVIYDGAIGLADNVIAPDGSVAIRICQDPFCRHLIKRFGKPIVSTSANLAGQPMPGCFDDIDPVIRVGVDFVVQHRRDDRNMTISSSLIRWDLGKPVQIRP